MMEDDDCDNDDDDDDEDDHDDDADEEAVRSRSFLLVPITSADYR